MQSRTKLYNGLQKCPVSIVEEALSMNVGLNAHIQDTNASVSRILSGVNGHCAIAPNGLLLYGQPHGRTRSVPPSRPVESDELTWQSRMLDCSWMTGCSELSASRIVISGWPTIRPKHDRGYMKVRGKRFYGPVSAPPCFVNCEDQTNYPALSEIT